ncbi:MAG: heme o synthase [Bdellovibrionota bacterium]
MNLSTLRATAQTVSLEGSVPSSSIFAKIADYVQLTKPRIVLLFALTGLAAIVMEGSLRAEPLKLWAIVLGIVLTAGSANALNQYIDRDIDAVMERTRKKRPLPAGRLSPQSALFFGLATGTIATALLYGFGNLLTAALGVGTILFYVGIYTLWLKRRTPYNIVIGGAAGATAPLIGWAAATGHLSVGALVMFLIVFVWTPPHFWALALCVKEEYAQVSVPMLPVVAGEEATRRQILAYSVALIPLTLVLGLTKDCGWVYIVSAALLGAGFLFKAWNVLKKKDTQSSWRLFGYSIVYLLALYTVMIIDALVGLKP